MAAVGTGTVKHLQARKGNANGKEKRRTTNQLCIPNAIYEGIKRHAEQQKKKKKRENSVFVKQKGESK